MVRNSASVTFLKMCYYGRQWDWIWCNDTCKSLKLYVTVCFLGLFVNGSYKTACSYSGPMVRNSASVTFLKMCYYGRQWDLIWCNDTCKSLKLYVTVCFLGLFVNGSYKTACSYSGPMVRNSASVTFLKMCYYGRQWDLIWCNDTCKSLKLYVTVCFLGLFVNGSYKTACSYSGPMVRNSASVTFLKMCYYGRQWDLIWCNDTCKSLKLYVTVCFLGLFVNGSYKTACSYSGPMVRNSASVTFLKICYNGRQWDLIWCNDTCRTYRSDVFHLRVEIVEFTSVLVELSLQLFSP